MRRVAYFSFIVIILVLIVISYTSLNVGKYMRNHFKVSDHLLPHSRPPPANRTFNSTVINDVVAQVTKIMKDEKLGKIFENCFPNTLDTTVQNFTLDPLDTFVITGDIEAMWLRDSTNQVFPYIPFAIYEDKLKLMLHGLINRQVNCVLNDTYANAFNYGPTGSPWDSDKTTKIVDGKHVNAMTPWLWERKFEIDSLAAVLKLSTEFYYYTQDGSFIDDRYLQAVTDIISTLRIQQRGSREEDELHYIPYTFQRNTPEPTDTLSHGRGFPAKTCGLIKSAFRPSDDATQLPFLIPANAMVSVYLQKLANMLKEVKQKKNLLSDTIDSIIKEAESLSSEVKEAINKYGVTLDQKGRKVYAYEVDGYGNYLKMDDANVPSLLSLPFLGFVSINDEIYRNTRELVLSLEENPYYFKGLAGEGVGGPHEGLKYIWPMAIIVRAITSNDDNEIMNCLTMLRDTTADTEFMHESFNQNDAFVYTRPWFAWANTFFGEMILHILDTKPYLITNYTDIKQIKALHPYFNKIRFQNP